MVLDFLEVILDAAEAAAQPVGLEEEEELRRARVEPQRCPDGWTLMKTMGSQGENLGNSWYPLVI